MKSENGSSGTVVKAERSCCEKLKSETKKRWYSVTTSATSVTPTETTSRNHSEEAEERDQECGSCDTSENDESGAESEHYNENEDMVFPPAKKRAKKIMNVRRR